MELLIISENKIKISLSKNDLDSYNISSESIDYDTTETRRVVWSLLDDVKKQIGFDAAKSRIFVQLYPGRDGGCEMYVSKLGLGVDIALKNENSTPQKTKIEAVSREYYIFDGINEVLAVCKMLCSQGYSGHSDAYADEDGRFILAAEVGTERMMFVSEFGARQSSDTVELYIREHCRAVCKDNAVSTLGVL